MIIMILVGIFFGIISMMIAQEKGRNNYIWFAIGFFFSIFGLLVFFLPAVAREGFNKECTNCREVIKEQAAACRYCGTNQ